MNAGCSCRIRGGSARDAQPRHAVRACRDVDSGAGRAGRHMGTRALLPGAGRHRQLEHRVAAARLLVGRVRRLRRRRVKGGVSRYDRLEGITLVQPLNQRNIAFQTCPWTDTNGDLTAQNGEIKFAKCTGSLLPSLGQVNPNLKRPHQWEYTVMVQRQMGQTRR